MTTAPLCHVLLAGAILAGTFGIVHGAPEVQATATTRAQSPRTPLFSARRVPGLVLAADRAPILRGELNDVVAASPTDSCLSVGDAGRTLFADQATRSRSPASNLKLLTAQLALDLLGSDHRYTTTVSGQRPEEGRVAGDLYLVGGGDPVLQTDAYREHFKDPASRGTSIEKLADRVVAAGVRHVTGSVVGDESRYDSQRAVSGWPDRYLEQHQLGPLTALEVNQSFTAFPEVFSEHTLDQLEPAADPPVFAATVFADLLRARGVRIDGDVRAGRRPVGLPEVAKIRSPPLSQIAEQMLRRSDNQIAELLVKEVGREKGAGGTTDDGLAVFRAELDRLGFITKGIVLRDGSGLDHDNRLSCAILEGLLTRAGPDSTIGRGLAVGGRSGTLKDRFTSPELTGRIRAKTGTLNDVSALSGFADSRHGPTLVFSYIANGHYVSPELLEVQDRLAESLVGYAGDVRLSSLGPR